MTQLRNAYNSIVLDLDAENQRVDISQKLLEDMLFLEIGASKPETLKRNIRLMVAFGYLTANNLGYGVHTYDLVAKKVKSVRANMEK